MVAERAVNLIKMIPTGVMEVLEAITPFGRVLAVLISIAAGLVLLSTRLRSRRTIKTQGRLADEDLRKAVERACPHFDEQEIRRATKGYVIPDCSQVDPGNEPEFGRFAQVRESVFKSVDRFFDVASEKKHLLILADSGVGKTAFCINFFARSQKRGAAPQVALVSLARRNAEDSIKQVPSKRTTILVLDALDEDPKAIKTGTTRLYNILKLCEDFKGVVVTCRSHFFENDAAIPTQTGISRITPRSPSQGASYELYRLYLLPFTPDQVSRFLRGQFSFFAFAARRKARELVRTIPDLSARPMLLALVPELVRQNKHISEIYDLYEYMVDQWLERESGWVEKTLLESVSNALAIYLMQRKQQVGIDRVNPDEVRKLTAVADNIDWDLLTTRSLLNRDSDGQLKFAHRSIMEFLTVRLALRDDARAATLIWTGFMRELLFSYGAGQSPRKLQIIGPLVRSLMDNRSRSRFPYADPLPEPATRNKPELMYLADFGGIKHGSNRDIPIGWRGTTIRADKFPDLLTVQDKEFDLYWRLPNTEGPDFARDPSIYRITQTEAFRSLQNNDRRRPSFVEFISLVAVDRFCLSDTPVLEQQEFYWLGDRLGSGENLLASLGNVLPEGSGSLILSSIRLYGRTVRLNVFAVSPFRGPQENRVVRGLDITVSRLSESSVRQQ